jgi:hypothetical protein
MRRLAFALALAACGAGVAWGQQRAMLPDPYILNENAFWVWPSRDIAGKTLSTQTINTGIQNCVILTAGQSNYINTAPTPYTPTNPNAIDNLNIYDGAIYKAVDPLIGASGAIVGSVAHPALRLADTLVTNLKCARVILVPNGIVASTMAAWATGNLNDRIPAAVRRIKQKIACGTTNIDCVIQWGHGETDCANGTSQATYTSLLNTLIANTAAAGFSGRWMIAVQSYQAGSTCGAIEAAQAAVVNGSTVFAGANADALIGNVCNGTNACRGADGVHWSDNGSAQYAAAWFNAMHAMGAPY